MKRASGIIICLILLFGIVGCTDNDKQVFYGKYIFEEVSYLSPLSSSTRDYLNKQMEETIYTINEDLFKIESNNMHKTVEISSPNYIEAEIPNNVTKFSDIRSFLGKDVKYQYTIGLSHKRLYVSSDSIWIASYVDNTADGSEIIMDIFKLSKITE